MSLQRKRAFAAALLTSLSLCPAAAFTDEETRRIFETLDPAHDGKVTRVDFDLNKMNAFYRSRIPDRSGRMKPLTFEETGLSREFFDKADQGQKGHLDGIDIIDAIRFDDVDTRHRGYFDYTDLVAFLNKIGR